MTVCSYVWTIEDMMKVDERGRNLKRAINNCMGLTAAEDTLPKALLDPYKEGGANGFTPDIEGMLFGYYEARGWDIETGRPMKWKLVELGLGDIGRDL